MRVSSLLSALARQLSSCAPSEMKSSLLLNKYDAFKASAFWSDELEREIRRVMSVDSTVKSYTLNNLLLLELSL